MPYLFIGNIPPQTSCDELATFFRNERLNSFTNFNIESTKTANGEIRAHGKCFSKSGDDCKQAIASLHGKKKINGNVIRVAFFREDRYPKGVHPPIGSFGSTRGRGLGRGRGGRGRGSRGRGSRGRGSGSRSGIYRSSETANPTEFENRVDIKPNMLYVGNLPLVARDNDLRSIFDGYTVKSAKICTKSDGNSRGFGFVEFETKEDMESALHTCEGTQVEGRLIYLSIAQEKPWIRSQTKRTSTSSPRKFSVDTLYVNRVRYSTTDDEFAEAFAKYKPLKCEISRNPKTGNGRGFGFVHFATEADCKAALEANNTSLKGMDLLVTYAFLDTVPESMQ